jgi:hypothetical protein
MIRHTCRTHTIMLYSHTPYTIHRTLIHYTHTLYTLHHTPCIIHSYHHTLIPTLPPYTHALERFRSSGVSPLHALYIDWPMLDGAYANKVSGRQVQPVQKVF